MKRSFIFCLAFALLLPAVVFAAGNLGNALGNVREVGGIAGTTEGNVENVVGTVINAALTLIGTIFFILMVYAGYLWMTDRGNEEQMTKAKNIITAAVIGLIVVVSAWAITVFVTRRFESSPGSVITTGNCGTRNDGRTCVSDIGTCTPGTEESQPGCPDDEICCDPR